MSRKILITGTTSGLGKDLATYYLKKNFKVIGISRGGSKIKNRNYFHYKIDLSNFFFLSSIQKVLTIHRDISFLINNHASNKSFGPLLTANYENVIIDIYTNIISTIMITKLVSISMLRNRFGRIVNIGSIANTLCFPGDSIYASSKSFLETFTKITAKELKGFGISSNMISLTLYNGGLLKKINSKKIKEIKNKYGMKKFVKLKNITNFLDNKIFIEKIKVNQKIHKIYN